jgi:hypothetical protein
MQDFVSRIEELRVQAATRLAALGLRSRVLVAMGFVIGLAAMPLVATGHSWIALPVLLLGFFLAAIGRTNTSPRGEEFSASLDLIVLASVPFGFALADPARALAAAFLLFALIAAGAASLFANADRTLPAMDRAICIAAFAFACVFPIWFSLTAYALGIIGFAAAGTRVALAVTRGGV